MAGQGIVFGGQAELPGVFIRIVIVLSLLAGSLSFRPPEVVIAAPEEGLLQTIGDFLSLGANTMRELQEAISIASKEVQVILKAVMRDLEKALDMIEEKFRDNLDYALASVDEETNNILIKLEDLMATVNDYIQEDVNLIADKVDQVIVKASNEINMAVVNLEATLERTGLIVAATGAYLIDKTTNNVILVVAVVMLGAGLLLLISLLFRRRLPKDWRRAVILTLVALFFALNIAMLIPPVRASAMVFTGVGIEARLEATQGKARIIYTLPAEIVLGKTARVQVWGSNLKPGSQLPQAKIAGLVVPIEISDNNLVVLNTSRLALPEGKLGEQLLELVYSGHTAFAIVTVTRPPAEAKLPDLLVSLLKFNPEQPLEDLTVQVEVQVCNRGEGGAGDFSVQWKPVSTMTPKTQRLSLQAGECSPLFFTHVYTESGPFESVVVVDPYNKIKESNEGNNTLIRQVKVEEGGGAAAPKKTPNVLCPEEKPYCCILTNKCELCAVRQENCPDPNP